MKLSSLLIVTSLLIAGFAQADSPSAIVEATLTFTLKKSVQDDEAATKGDSITNGYSTVSIKNSDIIQMMGAKLDKAFSKSAKLIVQTSFYDGTADSPVYLIRDKGQDDVYVTDFMELYNTFGVFKSKFSDLKGTGVKDTLGLCGTEILLDEETTEGFFMNGFGKTLEKVVSSNDSLVTLKTFSWTLSGSSNLQFEDHLVSGFLTGTVKVSGAKILKSVILK